MRKGLGSSSAIRGKFFSKGIKFTNSFRMLTKLILLNNFKVGELERWKNTNVLHAAAKTYLKTLNSQKPNPVIGEYAATVTMLFV
jgi:hypothetical protein